MHVETHMDSPPASGIQIKIMQQYDIDNINIGFYLGTISILKYWWQYIVNKLLEQYQNFAICFWASPGNININIDFS